MPLFSIIIPTHNRAHLLPRCLDSVRAQTCMDFEVIVADDGSTDDTRAVVSSFGQPPLQLRYIAQANCGAGAARNLGASISRGEYLLFLDSDDEALPNWLTTLDHCIRETGADIVCCGIQYANDRGRVIRSHLPAMAPSGRSPRGGLFRSGTFAVRRTAFEKIQGYTAGLAANQQSELRCRLFRAGDEFGWRIVNIQEVLVTAHEHGGPQISSSVARIYESGVYILEHHSDLLREEPRTYASWAAAAGGCAAKLGRYREARKWFGTAITACPWKIRNYLRWFITNVPLARSQVWRD